MGPHDYSKCKKSEKIEQLPVGALLRCPIKLFGFNIKYQRESRQMKVKLIYIFSILGIVSIILIFSLVSMLNQPDTFSYDSPQWHLPEDAKARLGKGKINKVKFSPDGTLLAGISSIGVWLYDARTGEPRALLAGHTDTIYNVSFSSDGKTLASASEDGSIRVWDVATGEKKQILTGHKTRARNIAFSQDGKTLASAGVDIHLWDVATGKQKKTFIGHKISIELIASTS